MTTRTRTRLASRADDVSDCQERGRPLLLHRRPAPPLDAWIDSIWIYEHAPRPPALERILPTGTSQLIVNLLEDQTRSYDADNPAVCRIAPGTILTGVATRCRVIDTTEQQRVMGVCFRAGGTVPFFAAPASEMRDADVPLEALSNRCAAARLRDELLSAPDARSKLDVLERTLRRLWRGRWPHPAVAFAVDQFGRRPHIATVGAMSGALGMSAKRFIERFTHEVGVTPKRYCRIRRFQLAVSRAHAARPVPWSDLALACGYFDQAHFIHDFRAFAGLTPTAYHAARTAHPNHVTFLQSGGDGADR